MPAALYPGGRARQWAMMSPMVYRNVTPLVVACALAAGCGDDLNTTDSATGTETDPTSTTDTPATTTDVTPTTTETTTDSTTGDTSTGTTGDEFPVGGCGAPPFEWLPSDGMGEIIDFEQVIELDAPTITDLLEQNGFTALGEADFGARVYKIRYVTQDRGEKHETTGFVSFPLLDAPEERPVVVWAHGTSGFTDACAPTKDPMGFQVPLILAAKGFVSVAPDYIGMNGWGPASNRLHPYIVPEPTAIATLDSIRALYQLAAGNMDLPSLPGDDVVLFGASEGGFATLWADRYAPHYAPELNIVANVAAVPPTDAVGLTEHGATVFGPTTGALAAAVVGGWDWTGRQGDLSEVLSPGPPIDVATVLPMMMEGGCSFDLPPEITGTNQVYTQSFIDAVVDRDWEALGDWGCFLRQATLGESEVPLLKITPTLIQQGEVDDLVYTPVVKADLPRLCDQGYQLEHIDCAGAGHGDSVLQAVPYILDWVTARLDGEPLAEPCVIHEPTDCTAL